MATGTIRRHRLIRSTPERVYRAFVEPEAMAKWLAPHGFSCTVQQMVTPFQMPRSWSTVPE
jgi:uncharacterized protein YndB with AHSA1/START domain